MQLIPADQNVADPVGFDPLCWPCCLTYCAVFVTLACSAMYNSVTTYKLASVVQSTLHYQRIYSTGSVQTTVTHFIQRTVRRVVKSTFTLLVHSNVTPLFRVLLNLLFKVLLSPFLLSTVTPCCSKALLNRFVQNYIAPVQRTVTYRYLSC